MTATMASVWGEWWPAPAKLNLLLRIVGRRADGYHLLQTVFQFIDRSDRIRFFPTEGPQIRLRNPLPGVAEGNDLTVRAARLLQERGGVRSGVEIEVEKNLPIGGGLGGGSSDAATVLVLLNRIWNLGFPLQELINLGLTLGADVPIFIHGRSAWAEGVGEVLYPIHPQESWYVVLVSECQVSTAEIFSSEDLTRDNSPVTISDFDSGFTCNDCLATVSRLYPPVRKALEDLSRFGAARLTGTGACVFLACEDSRTALKIRGELENRYRVFVAKGCNVSPLHSKIQRFFNEAR
ncbi:MAG: 4-(cytidine 5'-diphospho)-2-C-methyl-D-erythritol kinase [Gammaproteobacteria bacterium]